MKTESISLKNFLKRLEYCKEVTMPNSDGKYWFIYYQNTQCSAHVCRVDLANSVEILRIMPFDEYDIGGDDGWGAPVYLNFPIQNQ